MSFLWAAVLFSVALPMGWPSAVCMGVAGYLLGWSMDDDERRRRR